MQISEEAFQKLEKYKPKIKEAKERYLKALAKQKQIEKIDRECKEVVLKNNDFKYEKRYALEELKKIIREPNHDYLMKDTEFTDYLKLVHEERLKRGLYAPDWNTTSDYKSHKELREARQNLINVALDSLTGNLQKDLEPLRNDYFYKITDKFVDTVLRLDC